MRKKEYIAFEAARAFAHTLKFKNRASFWSWTKLNEMPFGIPKAPDIVYKNNGWQGWGDWLGTGYIAAKNRKYKSFDDAKKYVQSLGIKSQIVWSKWSATQERPKDIPGNPQHTYINEWKGWGDFLGTGAIANQQRKWCDFEEARAYARSLKFTLKYEWTEWAKSDQRPANIPAYPNEVYSKKGWGGWQDWLGLFSNWNVNNIKVFVRSLLPHLHTLSPAGLHILFQQTGIKVSNRNSSDSFLLAFKSGKFPKEELEKFINGENSLVDKYRSKVKNASNENDSTDKENLCPTVKSKEILTCLDSPVFSNLDNEAIDFFIKEAVAKIWQQAFSEPEVAFNQVQQYESQGVYSSEVKRIFLKEYQETNTFNIPEGYCFDYLPNLMQRYTAYLVKSRKRVGNWSGTGAGKTLSAIFASRFIDSKLTVICCPNNVVSNWEENIKTIYPDSVYASKTTSLKKGARKHQFLILHYEFFQHSSAQKNLLNLLEEHIVDFVIIDEIHFSKQRASCKVSKRKKAVAAFLSEANARNKNLHVLGMSATPVINTLFEGKTLIELVTGVHYDDLQTLPSVNNCISLYKKFVLHGIRWLPKYEQQLNINNIPVDCTELLPEIKQQSIIGSFVDLEIILTKAKIPFILSNLKSKTIIYTHYIKGILSPLQSAIENQGWKVAIFTGEDKSGLNDFIKGDADILLASSCVGTGVDKLQFICNRLIVNSLPWTHAEFEQLKGRIYRQGQVHNYVDIFVPLTFAMVNGERWSWCDSRWKRIQFKKSIADAAVDGVIPEGHLRTPTQAYKDTMLWLDRLEREGVNDMDRLKISTPLLDVI